MAVGLLTRGYIVPRGGAVGPGLPEPPAGNREPGPEVISLDVTGLQPSEILGIFQSDVIIRTAILAALADMRANPWTLDYAFAHLTADALTQREYGAKERDAAKAWFLRTHVPVRVGPVMDESQVPCITVTLTSSEEVVGEATAADIHYQPSEANYSVWPALTKPFVPKSYEQETGTITLKAKPEGDVYLAPGMFIIDKAGVEHEILTVLSNTTFTVAENTMADFRGSVLKSGRPALSTAVESVSFREAFRVGVHVGGEARKLNWLHSVVVFALLRYKEVLLEGRGLERTTFGSSDFSRDQQFETENVYSRYIQVSGFVRQYWPKVIAPRIDKIGWDDVNSDGGLRVSGENADVRIADTGLDPDTQGWIGNLDELDGEED